MTQNSMQDQIVVVGGFGAIGSAICRHFAQADATSVVTYNSGAQAAKDLVASLPVKATTRRQRILHLVGTLRFAHPTDLSYCRGRKTVLEGYLRTPALNPIAWVLTK